MNYHKIQNRFKTLFLGLLTLSILFTNSFLPVKAAKEYEVIQSFPKEIQEWSRIIGTGHPAFFTVDKEVGWCVEPGKSAHSGMNDEIKFSDLGYSDQLIKKLSYIAYFGYKTQPTIDNYVLTQNLLWETIGTKAGNDAYFYVSKQYPTRTSQKAWQDEVMAKVEKMELRPSFDNNNYSLNIGETLTLTDSNNILREYVITGSDGLEITKEGNQLRIHASANAKDQSVIRLSRNIPTSAIGTPFVVKKGDSQAVADIAKIKDPTRATINITVKKTGSLEITKLDSNNTPIKNTVFTISYNGDMSNPIETFKTNPNGTVMISDLKPGIIYIQETNVPSPFILNKTIHSVTINANQTTQFTQINEYQTAKISLTKTDELTGKALSGAIFNLYANDNIYYPNSSTVIYQKDDFITAFPATDPDGKTELSKLFLGKYYLIEASAPNGYRLSDKRYDVELLYKGQDVSVSVESLNVVNSIQKGSITINKEDIETYHQGYENLSLGDATLEGAIYALYARENIFHPDGKTGLLHQKDELIQTFPATDSNGYSKLENIHLGKYYVKEIKPSNGYTLDTVEYDIELESTNQNISVITKSINVYEQVKKQAFQIIKISSNDTDNPTLLENVEFTALPNKYIEQYGSFETALKVAKMNDGKILPQEWDVVKTDSNGYALSKRLPYGTYTVRETMNPYDELFEVADFEVKITQNSNEPLSWIIKDDKQYSQRLSIVKKDKETNKTIHVEGTTIKIKNLDTEEYVSRWEWNPFPVYKTEWSIGKEGILFLEDPLEPGHYQIEEILAPNGYLLNNEPVQFEISKTLIGQQVDKYGNPIQNGPDGQSTILTVILKDESVKGTIEIEKIGEVLTGITANNGNINFIYDKKPLADAKFEIYANEDIFDPSNDGTILYKQGTLIEEITTDKNGIASSSKLPLGSYSIIEQKAPYGMLKDSVKKVVNLTYKDQNTKLVSSSLSLTNKRQKVAISVTKADSTSNKLLSGATFTLYANEDIKDYLGNILIRKNTKIESATTSNTSLHFTADLPLSTYILKETKAPIGYVTNNQEIQIDATYQGQDIPIILSEHTITNNATKLEISKIDSSCGNLLAGAIFYIIPLDENGKAIEDKKMIFTSENKPTTIEYLPIGNYVLKEVSSVYGFTKETKEIPFSIVDSQETVKLIIENDIETGIFIWDKIGEAFTHTDTHQTEFGIANTPIFTKTNLSKAEITIYAAKDITLGNGITYYKKDEIVQIIESDSNESKPINLYPGEYYYIETKTPNGYIPNLKKHNFTIDWNQTKEIEIVKSTLENRYPTYSINFKKILEKPDIENNDAYLDVIFGIYSRNDIYDYLGNSLIHANTLIATCGLHANGQLTNIPKLPIGNYYLKELSTNIAYELDEQEYDFEIKPSIDKQIITVNNKEVITNKLKRMTIQINKLDASNKEKILNNEFEFTRYTNKLCTIKMDSISGNTDDGNIEFSIPYGTYYFKETLAPRGYQISDQIIKVTFNERGLYINDVLVNTDSNVYSLNFENYPIPQTSVDTSDSSTSSIYLLLTFISLLCIALILLKNKNTPQK